MVIVTVNDLLDRAVKIGPPSTLPAIEIVVMCTGNICRSPMGEALLRERLETGGVDARVSSVGLLLDDRPADPHAIDEMAERGLDITSHRSRIIDGEMAEEIDLLIGMEQRHVREAVLLHADLFTRAYTLPDLVARAESVGPRADRSMDEWLAELGEGRRRTDLFRQDRRLEVADPIGKSKKAFHRTAEEISALIERFVVLAWSDEPASGHH